MGNTNKKENERRVVGEKEPKMQISGILNQQQNNAKENWESDPISERRMRK